MNRQEAINIVKKNWPDSSFTSLREALEFLIPELMNTDDEKIKEAIIKGIIHAAEEGCFCADNYSVKECAAWLEKQGSQKPADKVEPKFKVGDKIRKKTPSSFDRDMQVARIEKDYYVCNHIGKFSSEVVPFSKEASYELVEQNPAEEFNGEDYGVDSLWHAQNILERTLGKVEGYQTDDGILEHKCAITAVKQLAKQNNAWSEEDEKMYTATILALAGFMCNEDKIDWLKSLKDRVQAQKQWKPSCEQIIALRWVLNNIPYNKHKEEISGLLDQIKDL